MSPEDPPHPGEITVLLQRIRAGEPDATEDLLRRIYDELRRMARGIIHQRRSFEPVELDGTEVVNAAYARLLNRAGLDLEDRRHLYFVFARAMRDVLAEESRRMRAEKREGGHRRVELHDTVEAPGSAGAGAGTWDAIDLDEALKELEATQPATAQLIALRYYTGRTLEQTAELLGITVAQVRREWTYAKAWLGERLGRGGTRAT